MKRRISRGWLQNSRWEQRNPGRKAACASPWVGSLVHSGDWKRKSGIKLSKWEKLADDDAGCWRVSRGQTWQSLTGHIQWWNFHILRYGGVILAFTWINSNFMLKQPVCGLSNVHCTSAWIFKEWIDQKWRMSMLKIKIQETPLEAQWLRLCFQLKDAGDDSWSRN